ncbi:MAG: o-succinylbenzoate synthase [Mycobacterium sp.]|nr:o-succinylbenzoate synthase [Mycobacterium sp.]
MKTLIDADDAAVFAIPTVDLHGNPAEREGMLIEGAQGWGEFSPPRDADLSLAARWLTAATEAGTVGWPDVMRGRIPIAVTVLDIAAAQAHEVVTESGCRTAEVTVAAHPDALDSDIARLESVRAALGPDGSIRCDAGGRWDVETAVSAIPVLDRAAGGLDYVVQPCRTVDELAAVRRRVDVRIAADESIRAATDLRSTALTEAADIAVLTCAPMGGVRRALRAAELCGLPCVVSSGWETSVGLAAGLALAGALPELPYACALGTRSLLAGDLVTGARSLIPVDGWLPVAPMPPAPDPERLAHFALTDPRGLARWRELLRAAAASV